MSLCFLKWLQQRRNASTLPSCVLPCCSGHSVMCYFGSHWQDISKCLVLKLWAVTMHCWMGVANKHKPFDLTLRTHLVWFLLPRIKNIYILDLFQSKKYPNLSILFHCWCRSTLRDQWMKMLAERMKKTVDIGLHSSSQGLLIEKMPNEGEHQCLVSSAVSWPDRPVFCCAFEHWPTIWIHSVPNEQLIFQSVSHLCQLGTPTWDGRGKRGREVEWKAAVSY